MAARRLAWFVMALVGWLSPLNGQSPTWKEPREPDEVWTRPYAPFRIVGDLYYGSSPVSVRALRTTLIGIAFRGGGSAG